MYNKLLEQGENQPDLLVAALLHDVGKLRYRMNPMERALVVLVKAVAPDQAQTWGELPSNGWDRTTRLAEGIHRGRAARRMGSGNGSRSRGEPL